LFFWVAALAVFRVVGKDDASVFDYKLAISD
jgi:hypothetical protein